MLVNLLDKYFVRIILFFLISPGSKYKRIEIKEKTKMNNLTLDKALKKLVSLKIINKKKLYFLNFESEKISLLLNLLSKEYKELNLPYEIFVYLSDLTSKLSEIKEIKSIILFGSYSKLIYTEKSDIDIALILSDKLNKNREIERKIQANVEKISGKLKKNVEIHFFNEKEIEKGKSDSLIKDILKNGKVLF